jgi:hypothetical protein
MISSKRNIAVSKAIAAAFVAYVAGLASTMVLIPREPPELSPEARHVATIAIQTDRMFRQHPLQRVTDVVVTPVTAAVKIEHRPGSCTDASDPARPELRDYVATLRRYTAFAAPVKTYTVTCGGWSL